MEQHEDHRSSRLHRPSRSLNPWLVAALLVLAGLLLLRNLGDVLAPLHDPDAGPRAVTARGDLAQDEQSTIELFRSASPSVVHVTSHVLARDRFSFNILEIPRGSGSGFVWDADGHIVTNFHVIEGASGRIKVLLVDNTTWDARVVGMSREDDLAVLKIEAPSNKLRPIPVGKSSDLRVGQKAFAIGSPFSLDQTLTTGVISGLGRELSTPRGAPLQDLIQTDAAINPGNSGGPLLDSAGRLIGVNTAIVSPSGAYAGVGFAVPVDTVNQVVPQLIRTGSVERPALGVIIWPDTIVERLVQTGDLPQKGVLVRSVMDGSAAQKAGLRSTRATGDGSVILGDLITAIDGATVEATSDLLEILADKSVGEAVSVTVHRDGQQRQIDVTLQAISSAQP